MATTITSEGRMPWQVFQACRGESGARRRHITPQAGHALEILGHAIEYLTDEFVYFGGEISSRNAQLEAVQMLMGLNRQVYFECPIAPTMGQRVRQALHLGTAVEPTAGKPIRN